MITVGWGRKNTIKARPGLPKSPSRQTIANASSKKPTVYARLRSDSNAARKRTGCSAWRKAKLHADTTKSAPAAAPPKNKYAMINDPYKAPRVEFDRVFRHYPTK